MFKPIAVAVLLSLTGCTAKQADAAPSIPAKVVATDAQAKFDLGRDFCGGCVAGVRKHLADVDGVGEVVYQDGAKDFTIHFDSKKVKPEQIVAKLVASGEPGTKQLP